MVFHELQLTIPLQFLINSDFVTSASRESITDCAWNDAISDEVSRTFVSAVTYTFATPRHALRYSWLDYLPTKSMEHEWQSLYNAILGSLKLEPVVQTRKKRQFRLPSEVRILPLSAFHHGEPILPDLANEVYLAAEYTQERKERLKELGLRVLSWDELIDRLQADLVDPSSRLKTTAKTDPWHAAFADLLIEALNNSNDAFRIKIKQRISKQAIIPLTEDGRWTGAPGASRGGSSKVYFAFTGSTPIPRSLSWRLLDTTACQSIKRKAFYKALGVEECPKEIVFAKIKERHQTTLTLFDIIPELQYLFHQHYDVDDIKSWICVPLISGKIVKACEHNLYFPSSGEYDMNKLVQSSLSHKILSEALFDAETATVRVSNEDWKAWLARVTGALYYPALLGARNEVGYPLSTGLKTVLAGNPTKFLGTLRAHWSTYQANAHWVSSELKLSSIPCRSKVNKELRRTYLPTNEIMAEIERLAVDRDVVPLLDVPEGTLDETSHRTWKFLEEFGVSSKPDLRLYKICIASKSREPEPEIRKVVEIYHGIARLAMLADCKSLR
jgi:hypothetical protein